MAVTWGMEGGEPCCKGYPLGYSGTQEETKTTVVNSMSSGNGRVARIAVGVAMMGTGLASGGGWVALSIVGLAPLAAGAFGVSLLAPLIHLPLRPTGSPGA